MGIFKIHYTEAHKGLKGSSGEEYITIWLHLVIILQRGNLVGISEREPCTNNVNLGVHVLEFTVHGSRSTVN